MFFQLSDSQSLPSTLERQGSWAQATAPADEHQHNECTRNPTFKIPDNHKLVGLL